MSRKPSGEKKIVVHADLRLALEALRSGELIIAPTETVYGLMGRAFDDDVLKRLDLVKGGRSAPYAAAFAGLSQVEEVLGPLDLRRRRFAVSLLPGPITLILPAANNLLAIYAGSSGGIGVRIPAHPVPVTLARDLEAPIWATSANRTGRPEPSSFAAIDSRLLNDVRIVLDGGTTTYHRASTVIDTISTPYSVVRPGPCPERVEKALLEAASPINILLLCSGNICRSPIAEVLLRHILDKRNLIGFEVSSAGLDAMPEDGATPEMAAVASSWGLALSHHRARRATIELLESMDLILAATPRHRERIIMFSSKIGERVRLMGESIGIEVIPDPYQSGSETYLECAMLLREAMTGWADRLAGASYSISAAR
ncbi:MAG: threonylcarbamoyl-AMP synthase [Calditrichaeota bacterium]|nr:threonylcarbamoyl-AMP synthase [Calditrichota bacterium]